MPDRILRAELLESEAWLALKDNSDRVCYIACLLTADNFGQMPAGPHRLVKLWRSYGIDSQEKAAKVFGDLVDVDLLRRYEADGKPYLYIPRFRQLTRWLGHLWPLSPWATNEQKQRLALKPPADLGEPSDEVELEVEVDVEEVLKPLVIAKPAMTQTTSPKASKKRATRLPDDWRVPDQWLEWADTVHGIDRQRGVRISLAFRDFWVAKAGANACKLDWAATWRNWIRKEVGDA